MESLESLASIAFGTLISAPRKTAEEPLEVRREKLWKMLAPVEGKVTFAVYKNFDDINEEEIQVTYAILWGFEVRL